MKSVAPSFSVGSSRNLQITTTCKNGSDRTNDGSYVTLIVKIAYEQSVGYVFSLINFKLSQSDVFDKMSVKFETGSCGVKTIGH